MSPEDVLLLDQGFSNVGDNVQQAGVTSSNRPGLVCSAREANSAEA